MTQKPFVYQPGALLHEALIGAFRAHGTSFARWCEENGVKETSARQASFGQSRGETGSVLLERMIDAAGRATVQQVYEARLLDHAADVKKAAVR